MYNWRDEEFELDDEAPSKIPSLLSSHLDSPLRINYCQYVLKNHIKILKWSHPPQNLDRGLQFMCQDFTLIHQKFHFDYFTIVESSCFSVLSSVCVDTKTKSNSILDISKFISVSLRNLELQLDSCKNDVLSPSKMLINLESVIKDRKSLFRKLPSSILDHFAWYKLLYQAVLLTGMTDKDQGVESDFQKMNISWERLDDNNSLWIYDSSLIKLAASRNCFYIMDKNGKSYFGTREHLLLITDLFIQRFNLMLSGFLGDQIGFVHYLNHKELQMLFNWGDKIMTFYGDKGFDILSKWEPLCVGNLMKNNKDPFCDNEKFLSTIEDDIIGDFDHTNFPISTHLKQLQQLLTIFYTRSKHKLSQAFGLFRIWGHPNIDPREGITKLKQIACQPKILNPVKVREVSCIFMEQFCLNFRMKKGYWPEINIDKLSKHNVIRRSVETNSTLSTVARYYNRADWMKVSFEKTFELNDKLNLSELISDKAMSLGLNELYEQVLKYHNIGLATDKAVIIQWLKSNLISPIDFLKSIDESGFGENESVFGVCPKERELKIAARFFGLSTLRKRMYIVLTEAMIAEYIVPYFPQITMMDDAITLSKKFFDKTRDMTQQATYANKRAVNIVTNIDFKKWNTYMREGETMKIFTEMDHLFGFNHCISRTHEMFSGSIMYLADGSYLPNMRRINGKPTMLLDDYCWDHHLGGIEGLRQKGWTIFTVCVLIHVMEPFSQKFSLMGQGDNQVLIVHYSTVYSITQIKSIHDRIINHMDTILKLIGPPLKREETWSSSNIFIYGKVMFLNGCPLSMSQKKICRMFPMSNEGFPTVETAVSSLTANCSSSCSSDFNPIVPFILYGFWSSLIFDNMLLFSYLGYSVHQTIFDNCKKDIYVKTGTNRKLNIPFSIPPHLYSHVKQRSEDLLLSFNLFPKIMGGFPICYFNHFLIKNFPDPVTEFLAILKPIIPLLKGEEKTLVENALTLEFQTDRCLEDLFSNPLGLNLQTPVTPGNVVKSSVTRFLKKAYWIKNNYIKEFLLLNELDQKELAEALSTMNPMNPLVGHAILDATLIGRAQQVVGQLDKTGTLIKITAKGGDDLLSRVKRAEQNYLKNFLRIFLICKKEKINLFSCSRKEAQRLRETSWKRDTITGVTVPYPTEAFVLQPGLNCNLHVNSDIGYFLIKQTRVFNHEDWWKGEIIGEAHPYFGSKTKEKVKNYGKQLAKQSSPLLKQVLGLQSLVGWATEKESNLSKCLEFLLKSVTDLPLECVIPSNSEISGSLEHRFVTTAIDRGGKVELMFNFTTYLVMSTDTLSAYSKGTKNVNLHFQACLSYFASLFSVFRSMQIDIEQECYHGHQQCMDCITEINEEKLDLDPFNWSNLFISNPKSEFCFVSREKFEMKHMIGDNQYCRLSPNNSLLQNEKWIQYRACRAAAKEVIAKLRNISVELGDGKDATGSYWMFPVAWIFKLDPYLFIVCIYVELFNFFIFRQFEDRLRNVTYQSLMTLFHKYLLGLDGNFFGVFSSWFQHPNFLDYITGAPFYIKPPTNPNLSRRSCGTCFLKILVALHSLISKDKVDLGSSFPWGNITIQGDESLDSHPLLFLLVISNLAQNDYISVSTNPRIYLSLKHILPKLYKRSEFLLPPIMNDILLNLDQFRNFLTYSEIEQLKLFIKHTHIYYANETADGLISKLGSYLLQPQLTQPKKLPIDLLPSSIYCQPVPTIEKMSRIRDEKLEIPELLDLPPVSLEVHRLKMESYPTTAAYKLLGIMTFLKPSSFEKPVVGCFADGAGGFSRLIAMTTNAQIFYNDLITPSTMFTNAIGHGFPPCFAGFPGLRQKLLNLRFTYEGISDLTHSNFSQKFIEESGVKCDVIICDAEGGDWADGDKGLQILCNLCRIACIQGCSLMIIKSYYQNWTSFCLQLYILCDHFREVGIMRSMFSSKNSSEIYLYAMSTKKSVCITHITNGTLFNVETFFTVGFVETLKRTLLSYSKRVPSDYCSKSYSKMLRLNQEFRSSTLSFYLLSPTLAKVFSGEKENFIMPEDFMRDSYLNTHLVKFNKKCTKITKANYLSVKFVKSIMIGWLTIISSAPSMSMEEIELLMETGSLIFYSVFKHHWSFWPVRTADAYNNHMKHYQFKSIISKTEMKEFLTKSSKIRFLIGEKIHYNMEIKAFPELKGIIYRGNFYFHKGLRPLQCSDDMSINLHILKINIPFSSDFSKRLNELKELELKDKTRLFYQPEYMIQN